jgi:hypothetical protein
MQYTNIIVFYVESHVKDDVFILHFTRILMTIFHPDDG